MIGGVGLDEQRVGKLPGFLGVLAFAVFLCALVFLAHVTSGYPPLVRALIIASSVVLTAGLVLAGTCRMGLVGRREAMQFWLYTLLVGGPLFFLLFAASDFDGTDLLLPILAVTAIREVGNYSLTSTLRRRLTPLDRSFEPGGIRQGESSMRGTVLWLLLSIGSFWLSWDRWGPSALTQALLPVTFAFVLFGTLDVAVTGRLRGPAEAPADTRNNTRDNSGTPERGIGVSLLPAHFLWSICLIGVASLWIFAERTPLLSLTVVTVAQVYVVIFLFSGLLRKTLRLSRPSQGVV